MAGAWDGVALYEGGSGFCADDACKATAGDFSEAGEWSKLGSSAGPATPWEEEVLQVKLTEAEAAAAA